MTGVREQKDIIQSDTTSLFLDDPEPLSLATSFLSNSVSFAEQLIGYFMGELFCELRKPLEPGMRKHGTLRQLL